MKVLYTALLSITISSLYGHTSNPKQFQPITCIAFQTDQNTGNLNSVLVELSEGINPKAYQKVWKTDGPVWTEKVKNAADVPSLSASLLEFSEKIKPKFFKPTWEKAKDKWVKQVKEARSNLALAGLLKSFYNHLTPETFTKEWPGKGAQWVETLNKIE